MLRSLSTYTQLILSVLLTAAKIKGLQQLFSGIQTSIIPFFFTVVGSKNQGNASCFGADLQDQQPRKVFGPFVNLTLEVQQKAIELIYHFPSIPPNLLRALIICCMYPVGFLLTSISGESSDSDPTVNY